MRIPNLSALLSLLLLGLAPLNARSQTTTAPAPTPTPPAATATAAPAAEPAPLRYEMRQIRDRDGIGKLYKGREIAHYMTHQGASWLERPERDDEEKTEVLVETLKFRPGEIVADIGAGTGYFSKRIARKVAPEGSVLAVEIQQEMLDLLMQKMAAAKVSNVKPILGTITDPKLPAGTVDTVLMVDVYHEFDHPYEMMEAICRGLKPGGRVVLVEYRREDPKVPIKLLHKMTELQVVKEMTAHPLEWIETNPILPRQHIIIFRKKG